jgi:hypothetical protein
MRDKKLDIIKEIIEIHRINREYLENLYSNKSENLKKCINF